MHFHQTIHSNLSLCCSTIQNHWESFDFHNGSTLFIKPIYTRIHTYIILLIRKHFYHSITDLTNVHVKIILKLFKGFKLNIKKYRYNTKPINFVEN